MNSLIRVLLLSCVFLTGCTTLNDSFDCPAPKGGSCKRMDQVYAMVNGHESLQAAPRKNPLMIKGKEGVMRLWMAPYEDTDGNYHQANSIYANVLEEK